MRVRRPDAGHAGARSSARTACLDGRERVGDARLPLALALGHLRPTATTPVDGGHGRRDQVARPTGHARRGRR